MLAVGYVKLASLSVVIGCVFRQGLQEEFTEIAHLIQLTLLVTMVLFSMNIYPFLTRYRISLSKSCYSHIRQLRSIRPYLDHKTASSSTISTSIVHSKLD